MCLPQFDDLMIVVLKWRVSLTSTWLLWQTDLAKCIPDAISGILVVWVLSRASTWNWAFQRGWLRLWQKRDTFSTLEINLIWVMHNDCSWVLISGGIALKCQAERSRMFYAAVVWTFLPCLPYAIRCVIGQNFLFWYIVSFLTKLHLIWLDFPVHENTSLKILFSTSSSKIF